MITEDYVNFETAKLLKEKGFDEKCPCSYRKKLVDNKIVDEEELFVSAHLMLTNSELEDKAYKGIVYCSAPTLQMALKWLRETHNIAIETEWEHLWYAYVKPMTSKPSEEDYYQCESPKYEQACEAAIKYCLENLI